jgi:hypothetical protein
MRTTIELPEELLRRAEAAAATQGVSFDQLVERALEHEVPPAMKKVRREPPVISTGGPPIPDITPEQMEEAAIPIEHHIEILTRRR